jgi:NADH dehydrogenase
MLAEAYIKKSRLDWVIVRLSEVYGISGNEGIDLILDAVKNMPIIPVIGNGKYCLAPLHVSDAVFAIKAVLERANIKNKLYNIAGPENFTCNTFIDRAMELNHVRKIKLHIPESIVIFFLKIRAMIYRNDAPPVLDQLPRLLSDKSDDITEAVKDLGFRPLGLENFVGIDG